jgi:hypothetical protein
MTIGTPNKKNVCGWWYIFSYEASQSLSLRDTLYNEHIHILSCVGDRHTRYFGICEFYHFYIEHSSG